MVKYSVIETAVRQKFLSVFEDILTEDTCQVTNLDKVYLTMKENEKDYGCVLDYGDGRRQSRPPFGTDIWVWQIVGIFFIRFRGDVAAHDAKARNVIDRLSTMFEADKRLGGLVPVINMMAINAPEEDFINELPVYFIAFNIEAIDK